ncbi:TonB-dependent receptor, partial [Porticoccaceae bacterium]|nr:TonB-dependent receptor [Porticoccaceae bacterium]
FVTLFQGGQVLKITAFVYYPPVLMMHAKTVSALTALSMAISVTSALADHGHAMDEITIQAFPLATQISGSPRSNPLHSPDSAELLKRIPGANNNSNGVITGIAQYRGMYGDRVSVKLDQAPTLSGGPNAMDSPLVYAPAGLLQELTVYRGITPVSQAQESIGGHMVAEFNRGAFGSETAFGLSGFVSAQLTDNGSQSSTDTQVVVANNQHKLSFLSTHNEGDNVEAGDNKTVAGSQHQRDRFDLAYGWKSNATEITVFAGQLDISDSGTPALAMDIASVETDLAGMTLSTQVDSTAINISLAWADVTHSMDNFSLRTATAMTMGYRSNLATADNLSWSLDAQLLLSFGELKIGTDGNLSSHNSTISNPTNAMFQLLNFNDTQRHILGLFAELDGDIGAWGYQAGIRQNRITMDGGDVSSSGMMAMMGDVANMLAMQFNQADRNLNYDTTDLVLKLNRSLDPETTLTIDLGIKNRAPSYQETFLWLPLPITAGLADGRSYVSNLSLKHETASEISIGLSKKTDRFSIYPQIFYRQIDDYIQGVASTNMPANNLSNMMSGAPALSYENTDAEIYGADANWNYRIDHNWSADGVVSYVRGKRTDIADDLYRIAPANARVSLRYQPDQGSLQLLLESVVYARQKHVASYNNEAQSNGFGIVNIGANWSVTENIQLRSGVKNLFDRFYAAHLSGRNRTGDSDIALGEAIPGLGRAVYLSMAINF